MDAFQRLSAKGDNRDCRQVHEVMTLPTSAWRGQSLAEQRVRSSAKLRMRATQRHRSSAAEARSWFVLIHQTDGDARAEHDALEGEFPQRVDGLFASLKSRHAQDLARRRSTIPFVVLRY